MSLLHHLVEWTECPSLTTVQAVVGYSGPPLGTAEGGAVNESE